MLVKMLNEDFCSNLLKIIEENYLDVFGTHNCGCKLKLIIYITISLYYVST